MLPNRRKGEAAFASRGERKRAAIRRGYRPSHCGWLARLSEQKDAPSLGTLDERSWVLLIVSDPAATMIPGHRQDPRPHTRRGTRSGHGFFCLRAAGEKAGMSDEVDIPLSCSEL
jgi:hypothetical protein